VSKNEVPNKQGEATEMFTPFIFVDYDHNPDNICKHCEEVEVNAPVERCFEIWNNWDNLVDFLDLIGEVSSLWFHF